MKYKVVNGQGMKHPDLYQLLAYTTAAGLPNGLLVYAAGECKPATHDVTYAGKSLHVRSIQVDGAIDVVREQVRELAALVRALADRNVEVAA